MSSSCGRDSVLTKTLPVGCETVLTAAIGSSTELVKMSSLSEGSTVDASTVVDPVSPPLTLNEANRLASSGEGTCLPSQRQIAVYSTASPARRWGSDALKYCTPVGGSFCSHSAATVSVSPQLMR